VAKTFEVIYQAAGAGTGKTVNMKVFKPDKSEDATQAAVLTEIGTTGRYYGQFDAEAPDWSVQVEDDGGGKGVRHFGRDKWDSHGVADLVADVQTAVDAVASSISTLQTTVTGIETKVGEIDLETEGITSAVSALETHLSGIEDKIDALESPPMIG
jgi:hypothetical protein